MIQWLADGTMVWANDDNDERQNGYKKTEV